jgi:hypothetical protein
MYYVIPNEFPFGPELSNLSPYDDIEAALDSADACAERHPGVGFTILRAIDTITKLKPVQTPKPIEVGDTVRVKGDPGRYLKGAVGIVRLYSTDSGSTSMRLVQFEGRTDLHNGMSQAFVSPNNDCYWIFAYNLERFEPEVEELDEVVDEMNACDCGECSADELAEVVDEIDNVVANLVDKVGEHMDAINDHADGIDYNTDAIRTLAKGAVVVNDAVLAVLDHIERIDAEIATLRSDMIKDKLAVKAA